MTSLHLAAKVGDIAETVLLPGDPLRAKFVAETMLTDAVCYSEVRGMYGFTGYYNGKRVSIQGSGMGMGSAGIYINELISTYKVKNIIRVGTCGTIQENIDLGKVIVAMSASGDSDANTVLFGNQHFAPTADWDLLSAAVETAKRLGIETHQGSIFSTNTFYDLVPNRWEIWKQHGILGIDMESEALFTIAKRLGAKALSLLTVSDNILTGTSSTQMERQTSFNDMMKIAFEIA